jgi:dolichol kinase
VTAAQRGPVVRSAPLALRRELVRKGLHLLSAAAPIAYAAGVPRSVVIAVLAALATIAIAVEIARAHLPAMSARVERSIGMLFRDTEHHAWCGATWMLLAFLAAAVLLPAPVAIAAMWAVAVGDALAALVGRWFGRHRLGTPKSIEGSLACFLATLAGALVLARVGVASSIVAATAATVAEWPRRPLDDNLRIVLAVGCAVTVWQTVFA